MAIVGRMREIAVGVSPAGGGERVEATLAQVALAWLLAQGHCVVFVPGASTPMCLADNAGAADVKLSEADRADLDALPTPEGGR